MNFFWWKPIISIVAILVLFTDAKAQNAGYRLRASLVGTFLQNTTWPSPKSTVTLAVFTDEDAVANFFIDMADNWESPKIEVSIFDENGDFPETDAIFITDTKQIFFEEITKRTAQQPVLLITESAGMIKKGSCINFVIGSGTLPKYQIGEESINERRLIISEKVKDMAIKSY